MVPEGHVLALSTARNRLKASQESSRLRSQSPELGCGMGASEPGAQSTLDQACSRLRQGREPESRSGTTGLRRGTPPREKGTEAGRAKS